MGRAAGVALSHAPWPVQFEAAVPPSVDISDASGPPHAAAELAWVRLFVRCSLPKRRVTARLPQTSFCFCLSCWPAEPGLNGKRHEKNVQRRLAWAHQGRWVEMREALARPASQLPAHEPADAFAEGGLSPETARRLYSAAASGQLGKAWKQLRAPPPQTITEEVWRVACQKLRPHGDPAPELPHNAGPTRTATHRLVALEKPGGGTRGTIWAKVLSHLLLREARPALQPHLEHRQFGVGTPQGGLMMLHHIQAHLRVAHTPPRHHAARFWKCLRHPPQEACIAQLAATLGGMPAWL